MASPKQRQRGPEAMVPERAAAQIEQQAAASSAGGKVTRVASGAAHKTQIMGDFQGQERGAKTLVRNP
jgi:hypothetical protein